MNKQIKQIQDSLKKNLLPRPNYFTYIFSPLVLGGILIWQSPLWIPFVLIIFIISFKSGIRNHEKKISEFSNYMNNILQNMEQNNHHIIAHMQVGLAVFSINNQLQWCNNKFNEISGKLHSNDLPLEELLPLQETNFKMLLNKENSRQLIKIGQAIYSMETRQIIKQEKKNNKNLGINVSGLAVYLYDFTELIAMEKRCKDEKLALCYTKFDNYDEVIRNLNDSDLVTLHSTTIKTLTEWVNKYHGFIVSLSNEYSFVGFSHCELEKIKNEKFHILDELRNLNTNGHTAPTFSMGIATDAENLNELLDKTQQALDIALNRGGDQVVVIGNNKNDYFGASGTVTAKANKVRVRIISQSLKERMKEANNIIIMGHSNEDFDAYGACIGIANMAQFLNKPFNIVIGSIESEIKRTYEILRNFNMENPYEKYTVIGKEEALKLVQENTLLIMLDHHRQSLSSIPELIEAVDKKIIIDHHRRSEDIISKTELTYQEPSSSSTSEMVAELYEYFDNNLEPGKLEATCLYNGIILDSKKFTIQTGERTFEAAALLRHAGANVKISNELFADSFDDVRIKAKLLTDARLVATGFVISIHKNADNNQRNNIIAAQAADELIQTSEINGACVITEYKEGGCAISARSDGTNFNVQTMMEALGGGGHQLAASCQLSDKNAKDAEALVLAEITKQLEGK